MKRMLFGLGLAALTLLVSSCCEMDTWDEDYFPEDRTYEKIEHQRKDNKYVKGAFGYGYKEGRYSHYDYMAQYYNEYNDDIDNCWEEYCDSLEE